MTEKESSEVSALKQEIENLKNDLLQMGMTLERIGEQQVESSVKKVKDSITDKITEEQLEQLKSQGKEAFDTIKKQQEQHPVATLLAAVGIGFFMGKIFGGKS